MDDLVTWLQAQVAEDERQALAASPGPWHPNAERDEVLAVDDIVVCEGFALSNNQLRATVDHIVAWDPERVLAECEAKRQIIAEHTTLHTIVDGFCVEEGGACTHAGESECQRCGGDACRTLRLVALPYADRPGYREQWKP